MSADTNAKSRRATRRGLTLLELLVVVAILAAVAGTALVAYDGLEERAANGQSVYNTNAVQRTVVQYNQLEKQYPSNLDTGVWSDATPTTDIRITSNDAGNGSFAALHDQLQSWTKVGSLNSAQRDALRAVGVDTLRYLNAGMRTAGIGNPAELNDGLFPNSAFKDPTGSTHPNFPGVPLTYYGKGIAYSLLSDGSVRAAAGNGLQATNSSGTLLYYVTDSDGDRIDDPADVDATPGVADKEGTAEYSAPVETISDTDNTTANDPKFDGEVIIPAGTDIPALVFVGSSGSSLDYRNEAFGLPINRSQGELVVLLGIGPNCSIVKDGSGDVNMLEAPYSTKAGKEQYGRFFLAFHLGSDDDTVDGVVDASETFSEAVFLGVLDSTGMWAERALVDFDGSF